MMNMAKVEDAARETWEKRGALQVVISRSSKCDEWRAYHLGFLAGARWNDKQQVMGIDLASGPDFTSHWPNADADIAAESEGE